MKKKVTCTCSMMMHVFVYENEGKVVTEIRTKGKLIRFNEINSH